jgi:hypothetical protein
VLLHCRSPVRGRSSGQYASEAFDTHCNKSVTWGTLKRYGQEPGVHWSSYSAST